MGRKGIIKIKVFDFKLSTNFKSLSQIQGEQIYCWFLVNNLCHVRPLWLFATDTKRPSSRLSFCHNLQYGWLVRSKACYGIPWNVRLGRRIERSVRSLQWQLQCGGMKQGHFALRHRGSAPSIDGRPNWARAASRICSTESEVGQSRERQIIFRPTRVVSGRMKYNKV